MKLKQRIAVVVGGGKGLGRAIAQAFFNEGASVCVADIDLAAAEAVLAHCGGTSRGLALHLDVSQPEAIRQQFAAVGQIARQSASWTG